MKWVVVLAVLLMSALWAGCEEERRSIRLSSEGKMMVIVDPGSPHYDDAMAYLEDSGIQDDGYGGYELAAEDYAKVMALLPTPSPAQQRKAELWREQWDHWENLDAIREAVYKVDEDGVVDLAETVVVCAAVGQWVEQYQAAADYVEEYRQVDGAKVDAEPTLLNLEKDVTTILPRLKFAEAQCLEINGPAPTKANVDSRPTAVPLSDWVNMTEEEREAELRKDPCYMGKGPLGYMYDVDCQMRERR